MATSSITIIAERRKYVFAPIANADPALTEKQAAEAKERGCTHALRIEGRRPVALTEQGESDGYVVHILGSTNSHGAGDPGATTLGLSAIGRTALVVRPAEPARVIVPAVAPRPPVPAPVPPPPARVIVRMPVQFARDTRVCLTAAAIADGHEDRRGHIATVRDCRPSQRRPGEYSLRIVWDNGISGHPRTEVQPWWAGHFDLAYDARALPGHDDDEDEDDDEDDDEY